MPVTVFESSSASPCSERALVLQSRGIVAETDHDGTVFRLRVASHDAAAALAELDAYGRENENWQPRPALPRIDFQTSWPGFVGYALLMIVVAFAAHERFFGVSWVGLGRVDAALVRSGEWWRTITALTLHADIAHLAGNLVFGIAFGHFAGQYFGAGVAWLVILLSGAIGNGLNSMLQSPLHRSIGASTAVFGALGLTAAYAWGRKFYPQDRWAYRLGPIVGGIALLAYTGTGGERTDVGAHITGFGSGLLMGAALSALPVARTKSAQWAAGATALSIVAVAWALALG